MTSEKKVVLVSYTSTGTWIDEQLSVPVVKRLIVGDYGFVPSTVFINGQSKGKAPSQHLAQLVRRLEAQSIESIHATRNNDEDSLPSFDLQLSTNRDAKCIARVEIPYTADMVDEACVRSIVDIAKNMIVSMKSEYLFAHDEAGRGVLHKERRGHLLMLRSPLRGAYWMTFLNADIVGRLGGEEKIYRAPVFAYSRLDNGVLLLSHPNFVGVDEEPMKNDIVALHEYLKNLVPPEERP